MLRVALSARDGVPSTDAVSVSIPLFRLTDALADKTIACLLDVNQRLPRVP